jgi:hypothetical protein
MTRDIRFAHSDIHADTSLLKRFALSTAKQFTEVTEGRSNSIFSVKNPLGLLYHEDRCTTLLRKVSAYLPKRNLPERFESLYYISTTKITKSNHYREITARVQEELHGNTA